MKQVIIYNQINLEYHGGARYKNEELFNFLKANIDQSLRLGWKPEEIILGTNFEFSYRNVKSIKLSNVCEWSGFNNFWYGIQELFELGIIDDDIWLHDHDSWPISKFDFPEFQGEIAGCEYIKTPYWNCSSIYLKKSSKPILDYIVDSLNANRDANVSSDEVIVGFCRFNPQSPIKNYLTSINTRYNTGITSFTERKNTAIKPIYVLGFNPSTEWGIKKIIETEIYNLIDNEFSEILLKYFNYPIKNKQ